MSPASTGRSPARERDHLLETLRPVVESAGYVVEEITVTSAGRRRLVRVSVDSDTAETGIDLDAVAAVSRLVSDALDRDGAAFGGPYVLEVSSPGVERALTEPRHWRRSVGRLVRVEVDGHPVTGRVRAVADDGIRLEVRGESRELRWAALGRGTVQVEFNRPANGTPEREALS